MADPTSPFAPAIGGLLVAAVGYGYALYVKRQMRRERQQREQDTQPAE